jgi:hypothetical protein
MNFDIGIFSPSGGRSIKENSNTVNIADKTEEYFGGKGFDIISDTLAHTPVSGSCYHAIHFLTNTIISAYSVDSTAPINGTLTGVTFNAGTVLYGKFLSITLTSGSLLAYNGLL